MKRLVKFYSPFASDKDGQWSHSSTNFEVLPELVEDSAGFEELRALAKKHGVRLGRTESKPDRNLTTHAINLVEKVPGRGMYAKEAYTQFLGFVTVDTTGPLKPSVKIGRPVTSKQADDIVNQNAYGVSATGENVDGERVLVRSGWQYRTAMPLLGYSLESFQKRIGVGEYDIGFDDDTYNCSNCGLYDSADNGRTYNFREFSGMLLGVNCGCYDEMCEENYETAFANNSDKCMELSLAEKLEKQGKIKRLETFIGGMTDGRGGYIHGESTREGKPESVLKEYQDKMPGKTFVFVHDESGQFQTYFSIWEVTGKGQKRAKKRA